MRHDFCKLGLTGIALLLAGNVLARTQAINNTNVPDAQPWQEDQGPVVAPAFTRDHLLPLDMPPHVTLKAWIDPDTLTLGKDGVVRYVVVMTNISGTSMASYEGIRCETREVKTYARQSSSGEWRPLAEPVWRSLNATMPSHHALAFAQQAACKEALSSRSEIIDAMKSGRNSASNPERN